jgi:hypothetical protein
LIEYLRTGEIDYAAEAQNAMSGTPSNIAQAAGYISLLLMSADIHILPVERQPPEGVQVTLAKQAANAQE